MKVKLIEIIKKINEDNSDKCKLCCLDGFCLDAEIDCPGKQYYVFSNKDKKLIKYNFKIINE